MIYTVYIDVVFAVDIITDVMILAILNGALSYRTTRRRPLAGAVIGGIWSRVASMVPGLPPAAEVLGMYMAVSSLMVVATYHPKGVREVAKSVAGIYLVSVVFGGATLMPCEHAKAGYYVWRILQAGQGSGIPVLAWIFMMTGAILARYGFSGRIRRLIRSMAHREDLCGIILEYGEREEGVTGLVDTDNRLGEPVDGRPVRVAVDGLMRRPCPAVKGVIYVLY